jgi:hypothetical protein
MLGRCEEITPMCILSKLCNEIYEKKSYSNLVKSKNKRTLLLRFLAMVLTASRLKEFSGFKSRGLDGYNCIE